MKSYHLKRKGLIAIIITICILMNIFAGGVPVQAAGPVNSWFSGAQDATNGRLIYGITYVNGMFIACGAYGSIGTSIDGRIWTSKSSSTGDIGFKAVAYNGSDIYVAVGKSGKIAVSSDLTGWTFKTSLNSDNSTTNTSEFMGVTYGNGSFVAVTIDGKIYKSDDTGNTWTLVTSDSNKAFFGVTYVTYLNKFLAYGNSSVMLLSSDGETWAQASSTGSGIHYRSVAFKSDGANSIIVATGAGGQIRTSADGDTWTDRVSPTSEHLNSIAYGDSTAGGIFLGVGSSGGAVISNDGVNWSMTPGVGWNTGPVAYGNNTFVTCNILATAGYDAHRTYFAKLSGNITGTVKDSSGAGVSGATVSVAVGSEKVTASTIGDGSYTLNGIPAGTGYMVIVNKTGYRPDVKNVDIAPGAVLSLDFSLETDSTAPALLSPGNNATEVSTTLPIFFEFSEDIKIGANIGTELADGDLSLPALFGAGFKLGKTPGGSGEETRIRSAYYNQSTNSIVIQTNGFEANTNYYLTLGGIYDTANNPLTQTSLHFTTGDFTKVTSSTIKGISAPVTDTARVTTPPANGDIPASAEWTSGDITWHNDGQTSSGITKPNTAYEAHFTLTPKSGYTFTGIAPTGFFDGCINTLNATTISYQPNSTNPVALDVIVKYPATQENSVSPTAAITGVAKAAVVQKSVDFILSNSQTLSGTWKVYKDSSTATALTTVIPTYNDGTKTLTLSSTGTDIPAATYYITHTENGKAESKRLKLMATDAPGAPAAISCDLDMGNVTITSNADGATFHVYYNDASSESKHADVDYAKKIEIRQTSALVPTQYHVTVNGTNQPVNTPIQISLKGVNIDPGYGGQGVFICPAFSLSNNSNVNLTLNSSNTLKGYGGYSALQVPAGNSVTIDGTGAGSLVATGGANGAGIGGNGTCGDITINGGNITATGGNSAAGIGNYRDNGSVTINGGNISAIGGLYAAGIGGGNDGNGGIITITGGTVAAKGSGNNTQYVGAGIGGGGFYTNGKGAGGTISISGNADVTAIGGRALSSGTVMAGSGIGGAYGAADNGTITISGTPKIKALSATPGGAITASVSGSTAGVLSADFASEVPAGIATELCTNTGESLSPDAISICPMFNYQSVAFAVPGNNTYGLKTGRINQIHNTSGSYSSDFTVSGLGLTTFSGVKNESTPAKVVSIVPENTATNVSAAIGTVAITFDEDINVSGNSGSELADGPLAWASLPSTLPFFKFGTASGQNDAAALITGASYNRITNTLTLTVGTMANSTTYYLTIDGITDIAGNGAVSTVKSFTTAESIPLTKIGKTLNIDTAVPATGSVMADGANVAPAGANNPTVTWSTDGVNYFVASGSYDSATVYKTKYVYLAQGGYEFDPTITTTDISGSGIGVGKGTINSATVSQTTNANDTLTVVVTWPATQEPPAPTQSATPTVASAAVAKTSAVQGTVSYTLTNSPTLTGTWQVYTAATGIDVPAGITVSVNGSTLTLEHASDVPAGTYYVTVTESGKTESNRLALTVAAYEEPTPTQSATPTVASAAVAKTAAVQGTMSYTLTNSPTLTGTWQIYTAATGTDVPAGIAVSVNGSTLTLEHASDVPAGTYYVTVTESGKTESTRLALTVEDYDEPVPPTQSATPTVASAAVAKTAAVQGTVSYTLTNSPTLTGTWQVYSAATGTDVPAGITVLVNGSTLTLEHASDVPAGPYYVTVTESGKTESTRLALTVEDYDVPVPPTQSATPKVESSVVAKTAPSQSTVSFTLTNSPTLTGTWQAYSAATGATTPAGITVSVNGSTLTLEHASDVPAGPYYVTVTESGKTESNRLALTVAAYEEPQAPEQSATPIVASATVAKTAAVQGTVSFTLTNSPTLTGTWQVYTAATGTDVPAGITVSVNGSTLTLERASDVPAGTYYVTVTESGKTESTRLALTVAVYAAPSNGNGGNPSGGGSSGGSGGGPSSGNGTSTTVNTPPRSSTIMIDAKTDPGGKAVTMSVTDIQITGAANVAGEEVKKGQGAAVVKVKVNAPENVKIVETNILKTAVQALASSNADALVVSTPIAEITFGSKSLDTISREANGDVKITAAKVDTETLSAELKQVVGNRPVFNFSVVSGNKTISRFGGSVTVSVPYNPQPGEDANAIVIYYINAEGKPELVSNCIYDPGTGRISFTTDHFSKFAVGYNKVNFTDVSKDAPYSQAVSFVAARGIAGGTGEGKFSPEKGLTRAQFLVMMMKAYGIAQDESPADNFTDAGNTYYTNYLATAKRLGITEGTGSNMFSPNRVLTRQEMVTLLFNSLKVMGKLPQGNSGVTLSSFSDADSTAAWAKDAMTLLVETGAIGGNNGKISPGSTATRAEMAQIIYNLLSK